MKGKFGFGSVWTWTAICADTKLMISWLVGECSVPYAVKFIDDLASRLAHRVQLTTDGHKAYLRAVEGAFGADVDYAMLEKLYAVPPQEGVATRYSPVTPLLVTACNACPPPCRSPVDYLTLGGSGRPFSSNVVRTASPQTP